MEIRPIRYALAVAKERSFTRAAARLNVSQSAISEQVAQLEAHVGFALFRRTGRGVEVTDAGRAYLGEAERVVADLMSLDDIARRLKGHDLETITLGMGSGMAPLIVPALFREPGQHLGQPRLDIRTAPTRVMFHELFEERLDAAFAVHADPERVPIGLSCERLGEIEMVLMVASSHPLAGRRQPVELARALDEPVIMSEPGVGYGRVVSQLLDSLGIRPVVLSMVDNIETQMAVARTGSGIAFAPSGAAEHHASTSSLTAIRVAPAPCFELGFFRRKQALSRPKEERLGRIPDLVRRHLAAVHGDLVHQSEKEQIP